MCKSEPDGASNLHQMVLELVPRGCSEKSRREKYFGFVDLLIWLRIEGSRLNYKTCRAPSVERLRMLACKLLSQFHHEFAPFTRR
jgi:hypothetical protein